jgi:anti-sigma regulatory factor (Ser/Thr protein kinase)
MEEARELMHVAVRCDHHAPAAVRASLAGLDALGWILGDVMLVSSELVTNAVVHSGCGAEDLIDVFVAQNRNSIVIRVCDPGKQSSSVSRRDPSFEGGGGLGLVVVEAIASKWGSSRNHMHCVWAEIPLPDPA